ACFSGLTNIGPGVSVQTWSGTSNAPGQIDAFQTSSDATIVSQVAATLDIWISAQHFFQPVSPILPLPIAYLTSLTLIPTASASTNVTLANCVDENDALPPGLGGFFCSAPATGGTLNNALTGTGSTSVSNNNNGVITSSTAPYALE